MRLEDVRIVLTRPGEAGNVGAVCRGMLNMGLSRLRLAAAGPLEPEIILTRAVHAGEVWERAEHFGSLKEAVADCALVIGVTRRRGQKRKALSLPPREAAEFLQQRPGPAALVFGNEQGGLSAEELALCGMASHIPADGGFPSLNLSHAVQIYAYELYQALSANAANAVEGRWVPLDQEALDALVQSITGSLHTLGFYKQPGREEQERFLRDLLSRAGPTEREGRYLANIFAKAARLAVKQGL